MFSWWGEVYLVTFSVGGCVGPGGRGGSSVVVVVLLMVVTHGYFPILPPYPTL